MKIFLILIVGCKVKSVTQCASELQAKIKICFRSYSSKYLTRNKTVCASCKGESTTQCASELEAKIKICFRSYGSKYLTRNKTAGASCKGESTTQCGKELESKIETCADASLNTVNGLGGVFSPSQSIVGINLGSLTKDSLHNMCRNQWIIKSFLTCVYPELNACKVPEARGMLPTTDSVVDGFSYLCNNAEEIDMTCAASSEMKADQCVNAANTPPADNTDHDTVVNYVCGETRRKVSCLKDAMSNCQKKTAEIMATFMDYQKPAFCDATMVKISWGILIISLFYTCFKNIF